MHCNYTNGQLINRNRAIFFYRTGAGSEIDFIIETRKHRQKASAHIVCFEVKLAEKWDRKWERPMQSLRHFAVT
jgi:hypothetical protein